jgi:hypothetical protein
MLRITVKSTHRFQLTLVIACCFIVEAQAQNSESYEVPRTEFDQPDLQGVWNYASNTPLQRPEEFGEKEFLTPAEIAKMKADRETAIAANVERTTGGGRPQAGVGGYNDFWVESAELQENSRTSLIIYPKNGRFPALVESAEAQVSDASGITEIPGNRPVLYTVGGIASDGPEDRGLSERCLVGFNSGAPIFPSLYNNNLQIFQNRDHAVILTEMIHDARIVPIGERPNLHDDIRLWSGDSRGYYDGDTLVVETRNFNALTGSFMEPRIAYGNSYHKVLTERFTRLSHDTINYEFTIDDPATFSDKVVALVPMTKVAGQLYEYACHEGNYGLTNILRGARVQEKNNISGN